MTKRLDAKFPGRGTLVPLLLGAALLTGCGYTKRQMDEARRDAYHMGVSQEREKWRDVVQRLEAENRVIKDENQNLKGQLEQARAEAENERINAWRYRLLFLAAFGFAGLVSVGLGISLAFTLMERKKRVGASSTYDWTKPPPSVTEPV
jgi:hypothetical protein